MSVPQCRETGHENKPIPALPNNNGSAMLKMYRCYKDEKTSTGVLQRGRVEAEGG